MLNMSRIELTPLESSSSEFQSLSIEEQQERRKMLSDFLGGLVNSKNHLGLDKQSAGVVTSIMLELHLTGKVDIDALPIKDHKPQTSTKRRRKV